ncbi:MAG TPA: MBL fold metallo-hydrolase [Geminicoccaceae bacterium]|nr:MBL fold metallo-hydrolase [Geminicoccus sp.]HMU49923.1 MBL fold metallo-hydrolase [Geminicoccaceae bacterium]
MTALRAAIVPVTPFQQNCSIVWDDRTKQAAVVDPGGDVPRILAAIGKLGVTVEKILLTHGHIDHAGGAAGLAEELGVGIEGPDERDRFLLDGLQEQGRAYGIAGVRNVLPGRWLKEGDVVEAAGRRFDVLHCPGHTPGSVVLVDASARFALVGDVLFRGSVGRTDFAYGDTEALLAAIRGKLFPLGDDIAFICGHGPGSTFGDERRDNPFVGERAGR